MDIRRLVRAPQESEFVLPERVWYLAVIPVEPAGFMNKGQVFLLTSVPLQEQCRAAEALTWELVGFLVLFGMKVFFRNFSFAEITHHCLNVCC